MIPDAIIETDSDVEDTEHIQQHLVSAGHKRFSDSQSTAFTHLMSSLILINLFQYLLTDGSGSSKVPFYISNSNRSKTSNTCF